MMMEADNLEEELAHEAPGPGRARLEGKGLQGYELARLYSG